jgi:hypothetical protein
MKILLKLESLGLWLFSIFLFSQLDFAWWWYPLLLLAPDLGMLGYLAGPRIGAWAYNLVHHQSLAVAVYVFGILLVNPVLQLAGVIMFGHSNMDRLFGYGLKHEDSFQNTHLGRIGK